MASRILIGLIVAMLGAVCLDEVVFKADIDQQMTLIKTGLLEEEQHRVESQFDSDIALQREQVSKSYVAWQTLLAEVRGEADGSRGSGILGVHVITRLKMDQAIMLEQEFPDKGFVPTDLNKWPDAGGLYSVHLVAGSL